MGTNLKYDGTRLLVAAFFIFVFYGIALPNYWPKPSARAVLPTESEIGADIPVSVTVKAWHPNISVRQVSFAVNNINSTALVDSKPFVAVNLHDRNTVKAWSVGIGERLTFPRSETLELTVPMAKMSRQRGFRRGTLRGTIDVIVDHTVVTIKADYPPLSVRRSIPFELTLR